MGDFAPTGGDSSPHLDQPLLIGRLDTSTYKQKIPVNCGQKWNPQLIQAIQWCRATEKHNSIGSDTVCSDVIIFRALPPQNLHRKPLSI